MPALTEKGFLCPTYDQLLEKQIEKAKDMFGAEIDTREHTILGKLIRIFVYDLARLYEEMEGFLDNFFSSVVQIDQICISILRTFYEF